MGFSEFALAGSPFGIHELSISLTLIQVGTEKEVSSSAVVTDGNISQRTSRIGALAYVCRPAIRRAQAGDRCCLLAVSHPRKPRSLWSVSRAAD